MRLEDIGRLLALGAIWGASFLFMRVAVPPLGPMATAEMRVLLASAVLLGWLRFVRIDLKWRANQRRYWIIGVFNSAAPFTLFAYSAQVLPASYLVVLNATAPLFGAVLAAAWLGERVTARAGLGLAAGIGGVAMLVGLGPVPFSPAVAEAIAASAAAACCYAIASLYMKRHAATVDAAATATGSQVAASVVLVPFLATMPPRAWPTPLEWLAAMALGVLCTAIAYLLYFRLVKDVGPTPALTVTFLIPLFGMLWGALFLHEPITLTMAGGCVLVLVGTALIVSRAPTVRTSAPIRSA